MISLIEFIIQIRLGKQHFTEIGKANSHSLFASCLFFIITKDMPHFFLNDYIMPLMLPPSMLSRFVWPRDLCYVRYWRRNDDGSYGEN